MDFSIKPHTIKSGRSILYIEEAQVIVSKKYCRLSLKIHFVLEKSVDTDEMWHYVSFYLDLHCFLKYPLRGFGLQRV